MFIFALIIPLFFGVFYFNNEEFFDTASEQLEDGYTWHYVGPTKAGLERPSLPLQVEEDHPFVIFKLKKDKCEYPKEYGPCVSSPKWASK